ncbi:class I SAM-dependent methyltransferase [Roseomonas terrae]|uniref:Class I SAM-dependent methyltransferase n=1 Tax=Neoroseomonas terrae TaxID=424799 RepID=A0ABS5EI57_9PROT|nr:class I SAM-dependent methyltransferase [Neoroseomonas terrae]MBR0650671.1 class I SAM-dependent methyltransferase [Neoroseomonas terrae]
MADDEVLAQLATLGRYGNALQKVCDAEDWTDPRFRLVVRRALGRRPRIHPRQWEQAAAFLALAEAGVLRRDAQGIAFGSGREPLTYAVGTRVAKLTATDLYEAGTAWDVARTSDPLGFVMGAAPRGFPAERLAVHHMDMRAITYPDASFDFCYSISSFEHIGDDPDFLAHLREVRRVLKPGGLYALTTEVLLGPETRRTRGNYAFTVDHLLRLFAEAGLQAAPTVEMRLSDAEDNSPRPLQSILHDDPAEPMLQALVMRDLAGFISGPVLFLLRPAPGGAVQPVTVRGLAASTAAMERARVEQRNRRYGDWVRLNPFGHRPAQARLSLDLWGGAPVAAGQPLLATRNVEFGAAQAAMQVVLVPSPDMAGAGRVGLRLFASRPGFEEAVLAAEAELTINEPAGLPVIHRFEVETRPGLVYSLIGRVTQGAVLLASADIQARRFPRPDGAG